MDDAAVDLLVLRLGAALMPMLKEMVHEAVRVEVSALMGTAPEGEDFFKRLNQDIMGRLSDIYREISSIQGPGGSGNPEHAAQAGELMAEASERLDQVIQATEKATFEIIELVERNMNAPDAIHNLVTEHVPDGKAKEEAVALCQKLSNDLIQIMTCLSFQDLTGQRIKRVIDMLGKVRDMIYELYLSTGILMKAKEKEPEQPLEELKKDAKTKVSQSEVDDLLAQLGG